MGGPEELNFILYLEPVEIASELKSSNQKTEIRKEKAGLAGRVTKEDIVATVIPRLHLIQC